MALRWVSTHRHQHVSRIALLATKLDPERSKSFPWLCKMQMKWALRGESTGPAPSARCAQESRVAPSGHPKGTRASDPGPSIRKRRFTPSLLLEACAGPLSAPTCRLRSRSETKIQPLHEPRGVLTCDTELQPAAPMPISLALHHARRHFRGKVVGEVGWQHGGGLGWKARTEALGWEDDHPPGRLGKP